MAASLAAAYVAGAIAVKGTLVYAAAYAVTYAVSAIVLTKIAIKLAGKPDTGGVSSGGREQLPPATSNKLPVVYGSAFVKPIIVDAYLTKGQKVMYYVCALSEKTDSGTVNFDDPDRPGFPLVYWGDQQLVFDANNKTLVTGLKDAEGNVDSKVGEYTGMHVYLYADGTDSPLYGGPNARGLINGVTEDGGLEGVNWDANRKHSKTVFAIVRLVYNQEAGFTGLQQLTFKLNNSLTSPGAVIADYLKNARYGGALVPEYVNTASLAALDNYSNQQIPYTSNSGISGTYARYTINGVIDTTKNTFENFSELCAAADSYPQWDETAGQFGVVVNQSFEDSGDTLANLMHFYADPVATRDVNHSFLVGGVQVTPTPLENNYNQVEITFPHAKLKDQTDTAIVDLPANLRNPNEPENKLSLSLPFTNNSVQAQYIATRRLAQSRDDLTITFRADAASHQVTAGSVVKVSHDHFGWAGKLFRVLQVNETVDEKLGLHSEITAIEYNPQVYTNFDITEFKESPNSGITDPNLITQPNLPVVVSQENVAVTPNFKLSVHVPTTGQTIAIEVWAYRGTGTPNSTSLFELIKRETYSLAPAYPQNSQQLVTISNLPATGSAESYWFKTRAVGSRAKSAFSPLSDPFQWNAVFIPGESLEAGSVTGIQIAANTISETNLGDFAVSQRTIANAAVGRGQMALNAVDAAILADNAVIEAKIANAAITKIKISGRAVDESKIELATITANVIADLAVTSAKLGANAVTTAKIAASAVGSSQLGANAVTTAKIAASAVTASQLAANAVTSVAIAANAVTNAAIAVNAVTSNAIAANAITESKIAVAAVTANVIADGAVLTAKLADAAVTNQKLIDGAITDLKLANEAVTAAKIAVAAVTANAIATNAITETKITANAITTPKIAAGAITADKVSANAIVAGTIAANAVTTVTIAADAITSSKIAANSIVSGKIAANTITSQEILANSVNANRLVAGSISATEIGANSIAAAAIQANAVTATAILANAVTAGKIAANAVVAGTIAANAVTAVTIAANAVTANAIAANSVTSNSIVAGAVTTNKMTVTDFTNFIPNGRFIDGTLENWFFTSTDQANAWTVVDTTSNATPVFGSAPTRYVVQNTPATGIRDAIASENYWDVEGGESFRISWWHAAETAGSSSTLRFEALWLLANGTISTTGGSSNVVPTTTWTETTTNFTAPATAIGVRFRLARTGTTETIKYYATGLQARKRNAAELIVDGSIVANQLTLTDLTNMFPNGRFIRGDRENWSFNSAEANLVVITDSTTDTTVPANPPTRHVAKFLPSSVAYGMYGTVNTFDCQPGDQFSVQCQAAIDGGSVSLNKFRLIAYWTDKAGVVNNTSYFFQPTTTWQTFTSTFTAPANTQAVRFRIYRDSTTDVCNIYATGFEARKRNAARLIVDGSITGNLIAANTIVANNIAAGAITASKLTLTDFTNLAENPGFELGGTGWLTEQVANTTFLTGSTEALNSSGVMRTTGTGIFAVRNNMKIPVQAGDQFYFEGYVRSTGSAGGYWRVMGQNVSGGETGSADSPTKTGNTWQLTSGTFTVGVGVSTIDIEAVHVGGTGNVFFDDATLMRKNGSELIVDGAITTNKLTANAVTADKIAALAISAEKIQAGAITSQKLAVGAVRAENILVAPKGLNIDPSFATTFTGWANFENRYFGRDWGSSSEFVAAFRGRDGVWLGDPIRVIPGEQYSMSGWVHPLATGLATGWVALFYDNNGNAFSAGVPTSASANQWHYLRGTIQIPAGCAYIRCGPWINQPHSGTSVCLFADFEIQRKADAELIVDGTITANKIVSQSLTSTQIASRSITADRIVAGSLTATEIAAGSVTADRLAVNQLSAVSGTIGTLRTATSGERVEISDNVIKVFDASNTLRVRIGRLDL